MKSECKKTFPKVTRNGTKDASQRTDIEVNLIVMRTSRNHKKIVFKSNPQGPAQSEGVQCSSWFALLVIDLLDD